MSEQPGENVEVPESDVMEALNGVESVASESGAVDNGAEAPESGDGLTGANDATAPVDESGGGVIDEVLEAATRTPDKSLHEIDESEFFDPENGGTRRLLLVGDDVVTNGEGLSNWQHALIAVVEIAVSGDSAILPRGYEREESESDESNEETAVALDGLEVAGDGE